jgi:hypothetical protein
LVSGDNADETAEVATIKPSICKWRAIAQQVVTLHSDAGQDIKPAAASTPQRRPINRVPICRKPDRLGVKPDEANLLQAERQRLLGKRPDDRTTIRRGISVIETGFTGTVRPMELGDLKSETIGYTLTIRYHHGRSPHD